MKAVQADWRRRDVLRVAALPLAAALPAAGRAAADAGLPLSASLQQELALALRQRKALVVMVSLHGCPFCKMARESFLAPMLREAGQPIVQVDMQSRRPMADAAGRPTSHGAQVVAWKVDTAPTLLFLGADAREVAPRLVGASIPDFYGAYLDERVALANRAIAS